MAMGDLYSKLERFMQRFIRHINDGRVHVTQYELETHRHEADATNPTWFRWLMRSASDATTHDLYTNPPHCSATHVALWNNRTFTYPFVGAPATGDHIYGIKIGDDVIDVAYINVVHPVSTNMIFDVTVDGVAQSKTFSIASSASHAEVDIANVSVSSAQVVGVTCTKGIPAGVLGGGVTVYLQT